MKATFAYAQSPEEHEAPRAPMSSLSWVRAAGTDSCIGPSELVLRVEGRLGRAAFVSLSDADVFVEARAEKRGARFVVTVSGSRKDGTRMAERSLSETDCRKLDDALVLMVALMVNPEGSPKPAPSGPAPAPSGPPSSPPPPAPAPPTPSGPAPSEAAKAPPHATDESTARARWDVALGGAAAMAVAPSVAPLVWFEGRYTPRAFPLAFEALLDLLPSSSDTVQAHAFSVRTIRGGLGACLPLPLASRLTLFPCAGVRAGIYSAEGKDASPRSATSGLFDLDAALRQQRGGLAQQARLRQQLRELLHYHGGGSTLRTRQLMLDLQRLKTRSTAP